MILYLLKSALCLFILLLVHRLIFQREAIYQFNRFYLLGAVIGSFLIPLIELEVAAEVPIIVAEEVNQEVEFSPGFELNTHPVLASDFVQEAELTEKPFDWNLLFWSVYGFVTLVFLIRFFRNIKLLMHQINRNIHLQYRGETLVLLRGQSLPFSFLNYIFVSKDYFESGQLTDSIFAHEQAHVRGKHSWDNLLVEALLVPFWFHPGLYLARQAIKLNHEFIADEAALQVTPLNQYKNFLLAMMISEQSPGLASSLNFSLTKKRFEMMKRKTANSTKWIMILSVIPVLAALVYIFSEKVTAQAGDERNSKAVKDNEEIASAEKEINILIRADRKIEIDGQVIELAQLAELIDLKNNDFTLARISANSDVEMGFVSDVQEVLRKNEIRRVVYEDQNERTNPTLSLQKDTYYRNATFFVEDEKGEFIKKGYEELSKDEKSYLLTPAKAPTLKFPTSEIFLEWRDSNKYAVWLDGLEVSNDKLAGIKASDVVFYFSTFFPSGQRTATHPQAYKVRLFTSEGFEKTFGAESGFATPLVEDDIFYIHPLTKRVNYGRTIVKRKQSPIDMYLQLYESYSSRFEGKGDDDLSEWEQAIGWQYFTELGGRFFRLSASNKKLVPRANRPEFQYWVPLVKDGVRYYKKQNELTEEEKKQLPPPPLPPKEEDHEDVSYTLVYGAAPFQSLTKAEYYSETKFRVKYPNGEIEEFSYEELPENYKNNFPNPPGAVSKKVPGSELFESWKNGEEFAMWIDGKVTPNSKLEEMKASDIVYYFSSFVHSNARSERFPQNYQVNIYTLSGFENTYGKNSSFGKKPMGGTITIGSVSPKNNKVKDNISSGSNQYIPTGQSYQKQATEFQLRISNAGLFTQPSNQEIEVLRTLFLALDSTYFNLSMEDRRKVQRASFPYAKIEKDGQIKYKKFEYLTPEERNALGC